MTATKTDKMMATAITAADDFLDAVRARIEAKPVELVLGDLLTDLQAAFDGAGRDTGPIAAVTGQIEARYNKTADESGAHPARGQALHRVRELARAASQALVVFDRQADLDAAIEHLHRLEHEAAGALDQLRDAVEQADVDGVMKLRGEVEIGFPGRIEQARLAVLDLQIERALATGAAPRARVEKKRAAERDAATAADLARQEWERLEQQRQLAAADLATAADDAADLERQVAELRQERTELAAHHQAEQTRRMRRLAGLADPAPPPAAPIPVARVSFTERTLRNLADTSTSDQHAATR